MKTSSTGRVFIKKWEGLRLNVYKDAGGYDTIGHGHLIKPGEDFSNGITAFQADELLTRDLIQFENAVNDTIKVPLSQNQFDALVSYAFSIGVSAFQSGNLAKYINQGMSTTIIKLWWVTHYITSNGNYLQGLVNRRNAEAAMFFQSESPSIIPKNAMVTLIFIFLIIVIWKFI